MIDLVAYEPHGRGVLTLARAQREVTLWRASDWTPVWRVTLPGLAVLPRVRRRHSRSRPTVSPRSSPRAPTRSCWTSRPGAVRARRSNAWDAVLDVVLRLGWPRIVVAEPSLAAHCQHDPNGGTVTVLDAATLATVATAVDLGEYGEPGGWRGLPAFRASPVDNLVLVAPGDRRSAGLRAFRLSDGGALPAPAVTAMPLAFMPDGAQRAADRRRRARARSARRRRDHVGHDARRRRARGHVGGRRRAGVRRQRCRAAARARARPTAFPRTCAAPTSPAATRPGPLGSSSSSPCAGRDVGAVVRWTVARAGRARRGPRRSAAPTARWSRGSPTACGRVRTRAGDAVASRPVSSSRSRRDWPACRASSGSSDGTRAGVFAVDSTVELGGFRVLAARGSRLQQRLSGTARTGWT